VWHGKAFVDEFEWLRTMDKHTSQYLSDENSYVEKTMRDTMQIQQQLYNEMKSRLHEDESTIPELFGEYYYYRRYAGNDNFPIFCRKYQSLTAAEEVVLDQNALVQPGEYIGIDAMKLSRDHHYLAFTMDKTGSETYHLYVKDLRTGVIREEVRNVMNMEWNETGEWLYYTVPDHLKRTYRVMCHVVGTPSSTDQLVCEELDDRFFVDIVSTKDKKYITININSKTTSEVRLLNTSRDQNRQQLAPVIIPRTEGIEHYIEHYRGKFLIITNEGGAVNYKVMLVDCDKIADRSQWQCVIPHRPHVKIADCDVFDEFIVLYERHDGLPQIRVFDVAAVSAHNDYAQLFDAKYHHLVTGLPHAIGDIAPGVNMDTFTRVLRFSFSNPLVPDKTYDYDMRTRQLTCLREKTILGKPEFDTRQYLIERDTAVSSDQTHVPVTLIRRCDLTRDGNNPVLLMVYGAYGHSMDLYYRDEILSLLSRGWIVALAHVRGGGDLGGAWYAAGRGVSKLNSMRDFEAVAQHLQTERWTRDALTVAQCASAGGLVLGWMANQQRSLVHAMVLRVPFLDVLTTMHDTSLPLTVHEYDEWGNPQRSDVFEAQLQYDPYQNITRKAYPHMFFTASTNDNRVPYWHPAKFVAKLRHNKTDAHMLLLKTDDTSGHFGEGGRYGRMRECALEYAFYYKALGLTFGKPTKQ
jgi:oligopeptidase B